MCPGRSALDPDLLDRVPALAGQPRRTEELPGGLTNRNYKVTTPAGAFVARVWSPRGDLLAIDRDAEHRNSVIAAAARRGRPVIDYRPADGLLVIGYLDGATLTNADVAAPGNVARIAAAVRRLHDGARFAGDFDMFDIQRRYVAVATRAGSPSRPGTTDLDAAVPAARRPWRSAPRAPSLQQRPAGRELHRRRRADLADRLRVLRQQRPLLRARQHRE